MFKNLISFLKGKDFLAEVLGQFEEMIDNAQFMFNSSCDKIINNNEEPGLKEKIFETDKKINENQRNIRKRIVEHLTIQPMLEVNACLILMSVTKDAERLGDYSKNLFQTGEMIDRPLDEKVYKELFDGLNQEIFSMFDSTRRAFVESNNIEANTTLSNKKRIVKECDQIIEKLAKGELSVNHSVCLALTARYYKRIAAHLSNIATAVVLPITDLDYFDETRMNG